VKSGTDINHECTRILCIKLCFHVKNYKHGDGGELLGVYLTFNIQSKVRLSLCLTN
jgi:hypothetical protein